MVSSTVSVRAVVSAVIGVVEREGRREVGGMRMGWEWG